MEILPFLYLGSAYHASRKDMLDMLGITALINVSANCPNHFEDHYQYKSIPVEDNHKADISSWFNEAIEFIGENIFFCLSTTISRADVSMYRLWQANTKNANPPPPRIQIFKSSLRKDQLDEPSLTVTMAYIISSHPI